MCVPVAIAGRSVGVLHIAGDQFHVPDEDTVHRLEAVSHLVGTRLAMVRVLNEREFQASTDPLTGLLNRRMIENHGRALRLQHRQFTVAMGDLDLFKTLNDLHGHETGDRALRTFSHVLRQTLREEDVAGRYGGEEFLILLPDCDTPAARVVLDRVRTELEPAILQSGLPPFTVSFGIAPDDPVLGLDEIIAQGRCRAVPGEGGRARSDRRRRHGGRRRAAQRGVPAGRRRRCPGLRRARIVPFAWLTPRQRGGPGMGRLDGKVALITGTARGTGARSPGASSKKARGGRARRRARRPW